MSSAKNQGFFVRRRIDFGLLHILYLLSRKPRFEDAGFQRVCVCALPVANTGYKSSAEMGRSMKTEQFTFGALEYSRPDFAEFAAFAAKTRERIERAGSYAQVKEAVLAYDGRKKDFSTNVTVASIRHTLDTGDAFYEKENEYIENMFPTIMPDLLAVNEALMDSPFRADFEKEYGRQFQAQKELEKKAFCGAVFRGGGGKIPFCAFAGGGHFCAFRRGGR